MSQARVRATSPFTKKGEVAPPRKKLKVPRLSLLPIQWFQVFINHLQSSI